MGELKKDKECIYCEYFFDCAGKPKEVKLCLNFKERNDENGRCQMDKDYN